MKQGLPLTRFFGIGSLVFSKFWHGVRNPYEVVPDFPENYFAQKIGKMDQKWVKNMVF